jgi:hypothetical protein
MRDGDRCKSVAYPDGDTFRKKVGRKSALDRCDRCQSTEVWNAVNESGEPEYSVHFCPDNNVLVEVSEA